MVISFKIDVAANIFLLFLILLGVSQGNTKEFNESIEAIQILKEIERSEPVNYENVIIVGDLDLRKANLQNYNNNNNNNNNKTVINSPIEIKKSEIYGVVNLSNAIFKNKVDFEETYFRDNVIFEKSNFSRTSNFAYAYFLNNVTFKEAYFGANAGFEMANFSDDADFASAKFNKEAKFNKAVFGGSANFYKANFDQDANFENAYFLDKASFSDDTSNFEKSNFNGTANFAQTYFFNNVTFEGSNFNGTADFAHTHILRNITFEGANFSGNAGFKMANFSDDADFSSVKFKEAEFSGAVFAAANFYGAKFSECTKFQSSTFNHTLFFSSTVFKDNAYFNDISFENNVFFENASFYEGAGFYNSSFLKRVDFNSVKFYGKAYFRNVNFNNSTFKNAEFYGNLDFKDAKFNGVLNLEHINTTFLQKLDFSLESFNLGPTNYPKCDKCTYRWLIANFKELGQYSDANECYYMYRKSIQPNIDDSEGINIPMLVSIFVDRFLDFTCGYGVRPLQPIKSGVIIVFLFGLIFYIISILPEANFGNITKKFIKNTRIYIGKIASSDNRLQEISGNVHNKSFVQLLGTTAKWLWSGIVFYICNFSTNLEYSLRIFTFQSHETRPYSSTLSKVLELLEGIIGLILFGLFITTLSNMMTF